MVSPVGTFFIVLAVFLVVAAVGWIVFTQLRARRLGLPSPPLSSYIPFTGSSHQSSYGGPQPRASGVRGWISDRFQSLKNPRSAAGAYEPSAPAGRRGFGPLDPDEAWDARVGNETYGVGASYYPDDQELEDRGHHHGGGHTMGGPYSGSDYHMNLAGDGVDESRGRSPNPRLDVPAANPAAGAGNHHSNPFDDSAAEPSNLSMRGVSPRPIDTRKAAGTTGGPPHDSPTSVAERRSIFREDI
ncbi:hypothetical protein FHL15_010658 [Xylaria flabelliformis]|uniref:Acid phosphatase-like protein n=1 Tax=Xylaria flabelliformis TaxID=2512241 RepID=A0A553HKJ0_9PEZI|nr:hypothetical protein FHL15_010658 [Xylaria flabelliformis]